MYHLRYNHGLYKYMQVEFQLIRDAETLAKACGEFAGEAHLGFDVETTDLEPYRGELRLIQLSNGRKTIVVDTRPFAVDGSLIGIPSLAPLRDLLANKAVVKIAHNAKFDTKWVIHHLGVEPANVYDSYLASILVAGGEGDRRHGLADVAQYFIGVTMDKSEQVSDWSADELTSSQIEYAARDAAIMPEIMLKLNERIATDGLERILSIENECVVPIAVMELNGFFLDSERWREQLASVNASRQKLGDELNSLLSAGVAQASLFGKPEINLDSPDQVHAALVNLGIPVSGSTRQWELQPLADEYPVIAKLLEYRAMSKASTSFGENILEFIEPATGRIHADFRQIGAPTGRFSCSKPNLQQIPHENAYRRCFRAPDGKKLIIADYSQIELRILADLSDDDRFIEAFAAGRDFHAATASQVFGIDPDAVTPEQRSFAKRLNFGVVYGLGASRFAMMTGVSEKQAELTLRQYFATYPKMDRWLRERSRAVLTEHAARSGSGRIARISFDESDRSAVGAAQRYAKNMPMQGTSADILKRALRLLHDEISGTSARLVNIVHDEIVVECDAADADTTAAKLESAMGKAGRDFIQKVPIVSDTRIAQDWGEK